MMITMERALEIERKMNKLEQEFKTMRLCFEVL